MKNFTNHTTLKTRKSFLLSLGALFIGVFSLNKVKGLTDKGKSCNKENVFEKKPSFFKLAKADSRAVKYPFSSIV